MALYDFAAQADGDLEFNAGDRIEVVERTESTEDWWTGKLNGRQGVFPGTYTPPWIARGDGFVDAHARRNGRKLCRGCLGGLQAYTEYNMRVGRSW